MNVIPVLDKQPLIAWKKYATQGQTLQEFESLPWEQANGFALIGGSETPLGFLGCIDFDVKTQSAEAIERGRRTLRFVRITQLEQTPSGGQHWVYFSEVKPKSVPTYLNLCALELLGEKKLIVMAPSRGYVRLNDNTPTEVADLESMFYEALFKVGIRAKKRANITAVAKTELAKSKPLKASEEEKIIRFLCRYWIPGYRNRATMCFLGYAIKKGISEDTSYRIISEVTSRTSDEERAARLAQVGYHYRKKDEAAKFLGKQGLREIIKIVNSARWNL